MKILTAAQIRQADQATIEQEKIESVELMERAARAFTAWFENKFLNRQPVYIFCGPGNNSVDGLAVARLLLQRNYTTAVYTLRAGATPSPDFTTNFNRLNDLQQVVELKEEQDFPSVPADAVVIDALFGTGLNRPVSGLFGQLIRHINSHSTCTVAIDIPSGLFTDSQTPEEGAITEAAYTISFELPKLAFLLPQHYRYVGQWQVVPIGLSSQFIQDVQTNVYCVSPDMIAPLLQPRKPFSHKGTFGHVMLLAGSYGKMGAAVLATKACLRSGAGLVSVHVPQRGYDIIQTAAPEAMASVDKNRRHLSQLPDLENYTAVGAGPGLGQEPATKSAIG
ncbi:MAG: NAD(P)H-hydrate epimerase, partial [Hymenobacteraceae bacterium]|nr:NAD(P)H-hydrate epimerase [Hymenobacteraceae bacterium]MDX5395342.1 NAD(P)H-hydrate epimerase [Hymenobacteraceae bacterium]MDX5511393.1 NAD(P)H-hydrate epimerase [Hymenobacteraceae bacterium]